MTVNATAETRKQFTGDAGYTTSTDFTANFNYLSTSEIQVVHTDTTTATDTPYVEGTNYTVTSGASANSVTIRFLTSYVPTADTEYVTISRNMTLSQDTDYTEGSTLDAETLEQNFDKAIMISQQIKNNVTDLNLSFSETNDFNTTAAAASDITVSKANRASKALKFDANGDAGVSTYDPDEQVTLATAQVTLASGHASTASGHATTASEKATLAGNYANKVDGVVTGSDYSAKAWALGGTGVTDTASAGAAKEWATETSSSVDTNEYSSKEYAVGTQRRGAANGGSAKDWATYTAGTVDNSEYSAKYYATQAQTSAAAAATSFDSFDDRYLGTMADTASGGGNGVSGTYNATKDGPGDDNDGNALVTGALYFNTTDGEMRVYDGSNWIAASAAQNATILEYVYDITGSVTSIVGASGTGFAENNGAAVAFGSTESVHVYLNGVQLIEGASDDYQLTPSTNTVTLNSAAVSGDIVKIVVYKTFTVGDAVPASTGGTFSGDLGIGSANPEELLHLKSTEAVIKLEDSAVTGEGYVDFDGSSLQLNTHRNPNTGTNPNSKAPASIRLTGLNNDSSISFSTKASNSGAATERMAIDKDGSITTPNGEFNGTIGSSATFPAGSLIDYDLTTITTTVNTSSSGGTPDIAGSTAISITLPAGSTAIISASGGKLYGSSSTTRRYSVALISYTTDGTTPSASSNLIYGSLAALVNPPGSSLSGGIVEGKVVNSTGSDQTLKWNWGVVGTASFAGLWEAEAGANGNLSLKTLIFKD